MLCVPVFHIFVALLLLLLVNLVAESLINLSYLLFYVVSFVCLFLSFFLSLGVGIFCFVLVIPGSRKPPLCLVDQASEFLNREYSKAKM